MKLREARIKKSHLPQMKSDQKLEISGHSYLVIYVYLTLVSLRNPSFFLLHLIFLINCLSTNFALKLLCPDLEHRQIPTPCFRASMQVSV